jgi:hypothetical protein
MPLAGLMGFDAPFCSEAKAESPPAAAIARRFELALDHNRRKATAACPTSVTESKADSDERFAST